MTRVRAFGLGVLTLIVAGAAAWADGPADDARPADGAVRYDGHRVVRVPLRSVADAAAMDRVSPDRWSHRAEVGGYADYRIPPDRLDDLDASALRYQVLIDDVQQLIDAQREGRGIADDGWFADYKTYDEVSAYADALAAQRPDLATRVSVGTSLEGREIFGLRITGPGGAGSKPGFLMHGCQHAREWISVMTPMYLAERLLRDYDADSTVRNAVDRVEFYLIPIVNPDGYVYTWTDDRMWRKNRREWYGVDLNRNWGYEWGGEGSSRFRFSETYRGPSPFSEPETAALRDFMLARPNLAAHIDFHSYSQLILQPWGYTDNLPPDHALFEFLGGAMQNAIDAVHGEFYQHGPTYTTIYPASGVAADWTYGDRGLLGFAIELRDTGRYGFLLPADQIIPTGEEILPAVLSLATFIGSHSLDLAVEPLVAGQSATITVQGAQPGANVYFVYSLAGLGETQVPPLGVTLNLAAPRLAGVDAADANGLAALEVDVPDGTSGLDVWLQAAEQANVSNVVATQVN